MTEKASFVRRYGLLFALLALFGFYLSTKVGAWLAKAIVPFFGLGGAPALMVLLILAAFLIILHLGFASATALASPMIPIIIEILKNISTPGLNAVGMTMILQYVVSFGFILPDRTSLTVMITIWHCSK